MKNLTLKRLLMCGVFVSAVAGVSVSATAQTATGGEPVDISTTDDGPKFSDPDLLIETLLKDEAAKLEESQAGLETAETDLKTAEADLLQAQTDAGGALTEISDAETAVTEADTALKTVQTSIGTKEGELKVLQGDPKSDPGQISDLTTEIDLLKLDETEASKTLLDANDTLTQVQTDNADDLQAVTDAETAVTEAETKVTTLNDELAAAQDKFDAKKGEIEPLVEELESEQVFALNRSLNNAAHDKFGVEIDAEHLQMVVDGDFNKLQINSLTKALESKAKFLYLAEKTGNDKFLDKAVSSEERFMAKIDRFEGRFATKDAAGNAAKGAAKTAAKGAAKTAAKGAAKAAAKNAAKQAAKNAAKNAAKQAAKNSARSAARGKKS